MEVSLDKEATKADDPITVKVKIFGTGNIKLIQAPELNLPPDFEVYDPKISEKIDSKGKLLGGSKTFEYLVIPRTAGNYKIPPIKFSYFNLSTEDYFTHSSPEYVIKVEKGEGGSSSSRAITGIAKGDVELIGQDIRYVKTGPVEFKQSGAAFLGSTPFMVFLFLPFFLLAGLYAYLKQQQKLRGNTALMKRSRANKLAKNRLATAKKNLDAGEGKAFYDEITKALWGYLGDKLNIPTAELSKDKAADVLRSREIDQALIGRLESCLDSCEMALFSPTQTEGGKQAIYEQAVKLIEDFEAGIK
jgi:hypothetical protein